ncbi:hypothetical protein NC652_006790, partial [Populus alba x Populus x berolinensis]
WHKIWRNSQRGHERDKEGDPGPLRQISNPSLHPMKMKYCSYFLVSIPPTIQISIYQTLIYDHLQKKKKTSSWMGGWLAFVAVLNSNYDLLIKSITSCSVHYNCN